MIRPALFSLALLLPPIPLYPPPLPVEAAPVCIKKKDRRGHPHISIVSCPVKDKQK